MRLHGPFENLPLNLRGSTSIRYSKAGESCGRHVQSKRVFGSLTFLEMHRGGGRGYRVVVRLAGDPSFVWQELLDTERNAKCRKARVCYSRGTGELEHLGSTSWLLEARSKRTSHCQVLLELPLWSAKYFRKGSTTILPAASMLVPLMSRLMVDAVFWFTRQTARVNGGLSRNDSLRAGACLRRVHLHWRQCHHRRGDIDIYHEHSTRSSVGCSSRQSAASSGDAPPPLRVHPQDLHF